MEIKIIDITEDEYEFKELYFVILENDIKLASCSLIWPKTKCSNSDMAYVLDPEPRFDQIIKLFVDERTPELKNYVIIEDFRSNTKGLGSLLLGLVVEYIDQNFMISVLALPQYTNTNTNGREVYSDKEVLRNFYGQANFKEFGYGDFLYRNFKGV